MTSETRVCQNCKQQFVIEPQDFSFYEKIQVPPPTWCPECRLIRRFSYSNIHNLYKRSCAKCGKGTITMYSSDKLVTVYCSSCWWGDAWDGTEFGMKYDPSRPFFAQLRELARRTPYQALEQMHLTMTNSEYTNGVSHLKNCYLLFWADYCENALYSTTLNGLKDSADCYRMKESELCYEDVGCNKCYHTFFSEECDACTDSWFLRGCQGCVNCFACINMRNKSYCIFNEQYTKEAYAEKLKSFHLDSFVALREMRKRVYEFWMKYPRREYSGSSLNVNVTGDYIYESRNTKDGYLVVGAENCRYVQGLSVPRTKDSYDYSGWGDGAELVYECTVVGNGVNTVKFSNECWPNVSNLEYCMWATACKNSFGCINLKRKEYCILNTQYSKDEYEKLVVQIKEDMAKNPYKDKNGRTWAYGEFLPIDICPFAYNETISYEWFPKTKEEVRAMGLEWYEGEGNPYTITKQARDLPDRTGEISDSILKEVIACETCGKAFRYVQAELNLLRRFVLPLPHQCPNCRHKARFARTNLPYLYDRTCQKCGKEIKTSYAPDRKEIVYCVECYQAEIV